jgi:hypothetical protein
MHDSGASRREIASTRLMNMSAPHSQPSSPATGSGAPPDDRLQRAIQYSETSMMEPRSRGVLDTPLEPVIGLAEGGTRSRSMTALVGAVSSLINASDGSLTKSQVVLKCSTPSVSLAVRRPSISM